jgi:hypothetical protein
MLLVIRIAIWAIVAHVIPLIMSMVSFSSAITVLILTEGKALSSIAGLILIPTLLCGGLWAITHTASLIYNEIKTYYH